MIAATNVTIRVHRTTFIATSYSDMLATTKNHLPKKASSLEHGLGADVSYSSSSGTKLGLVVKHNNNNNKHVSTNILCKSHLTRSG
jgi:hypothetical protein